MNLKKVVFTFCISRSYRRLFAVSVWIITVNSYHTAALTAANFESSQPSYLAIQPAILPCNPASHLSLQSSQPSYLAIQPAIFPCMWQFSQQWVLECESTSEQSVVIFGSSLRFVFIFMVGFLSCFSVRPLGAELCRSNGRTGIQADTTKSIVAFRNFVNAPIKS